MKNFINVKLLGDREIMVSVNHIIRIESTSEDTCLIGMDVNYDASQIINVNMSIEEVKNLINQAQH